MAEWVKVEDRSFECHKLRIGRVIATATGACPAFEPGYSIEHDDDPKALEQESIDAAKTAAEQALREMHDALAAHFAPVLRWVADSEPGWSRAEVSGWELEACNGNWAMAHRSGFSKLSPRPNRASEEDNRRAVERELRSLGVTFRAEGE